MSAAYVLLLAGTIAVHVVLAICLRVLAQDRQEDIKELEAALLASRKNQVALLDELCKQAELLEALRLHDSGIARLIAKLDTSRSGVGKWN